MLDVAKKVFITESNCFFCLLGKLAVKCSTAEVFWKECYLVIIIMIISKHEFAVRQK